jgi:hypothetical protein
VTKKGMRWERERERRKEGRGRLSLRRPEVIARKSMMAAGSYNEVTKKSPEVSGCAL